MEPLCCEALQGPDTSGFATCLLGGGWTTSVALISEALESFIKMHLPTSPTLLNRTRVGLVHRTTQIWGPSCSHCELGCCFKRFPGLS